LSLAPRDGLAPYRGDLGQLLVVGLVQHPLLERIQLRMVAIPPGQVASGKVTSALVTLAGAIGRAVSP
jgi:hypothetical protein